MEGPCEKKTDKYFSWWNSRYLVVDGCVLRYFACVEEKRNISLQKGQFDLTQILFLEKEDIVDDQAVLKIGFDTQRKGKGPRTVLLRFFMQDFDGWLALFAAYFDYVHLHDRTTIQIPVNFAEAIWGCLDRLEKHQGSQEGMFRIAGNQKKVGKLERELLFEGVVRAHWPEYDVYDVAQVLSRLIQNLPDGLLTFAAWNEWKGCATVEDVRQCLAKVDHLNQLIIQRLFAFLKTLAENPETKMDVNAFQIVIGVLLHPVNPNAPAMVIVENLTTLFTLLINEHDACFPTPLEDFYTEPSTIFRELCCEPRFNRYMNTSSERSNFRRRSTGLIDKIPKKLLFDTEEDQGPFRAQATSADKGDTRLTAVSVLSTNSQPIPARKQNKHKSLPPQKHSEFFDDDDDESVPGFLTGYNTENNRRSEGVEEYLHSKTDNERRRKLRKVKSAPFPVEPTRVEKQDLQRLIKNRDHKLVERINRMDVDELRRKLTSSIYRISEQDDREEALVKEMGQLKREIKTLRTKNRKQKQNNMGPAMSDNQSQFSYTEASTNTDYTRSISAKTNQTSPQSNLVKILPKLQKDISRLRMEYTRCRGEIEASLKTFRSEVHLDSTELFTELKRRDTTPVRAYSERSRANANDKSRLSSEMHSLRQDTTAVMENIHARTMKINRIVNNDAFQSREQLHASSSTFSL